MLRERVGFLRTNFVSDFTAGVTGAIAGAPQAMGFALLGGVSPVYGLYATIVPTIVGALFSSSRFITIAPTNILMLLVAGALATFGNPDPPVPLFTFTLMVGVFQLVFGVLRFSEITRFVSNAVITGFITGAGVLILIGQLDHILGIDSHGGGSALAHVLELLRRIGEADPATIFVGVATTLLIYKMHHMPRLKSMATLIAFVIVTPLVLIFGWNSVELVRDQALIPAGLPLPLLPDLQYVTPLLGAAFATALLASVQHAAMVEKQREHYGIRADVNRDLVGQGLANMTGSLFQSMPTSGSLSRTAVNIGSGAKTRMANAYAGVVILLMMLVFGRVIEVIPLAALAGHLVVAALSLIDLNGISMVWRVHAIGRVSMVATFIAAMLLPLEYSIYGGVLLSLGMYLWSMSISVEIRELVPTGDGRFAEHPASLTMPEKTPLLLAVHGNLYFAAYRKMEAMLPSPAGSVNPIIVLRLRDVDTLGTTGINILLRYDNELRQHGGKLILAGVSKDVHDELQRTGAITRLGPESIFDATPIILQATENAAHYANQLAAAKAAAPAT